MCRCLVAEPVAALRQAQGTDEARWLSLSKPSNLSTGCFATPKSKSDFRGGIKGLLRGSVVQRYATAIKTVPYPWHMTPVAPYSISPSSVSMARNSSTARGSS